MVRETSAGGVVLRRMRGRWYLAVIEPHMQRPRKNIRVRTAKRTPADAELIALPKGTIDPGEKPDETALREIREETGVRAELITKLADIKYIYVRNWGDHAKVFKIVTFYLFMYRSGRLGNISPAMRIEVQNAFWLPLEDAASKLSYKGEREVAERALAYLERPSRTGGTCRKPRTLSATSPPEKWFATSSSACLTASPFPSPSPPESPARSTTAVSSSSLDSRKSPPAPLPWASEDTSPRAAMPSTTKASASARSLKCEEIPDEEAREVVKVFTDYGLTREEAAPVVEAMTKKPTQWVDFMMRFELGLEEPNPKRALQSALTIAGSYIAGGFIPLSPYMLLHSSRVALVWSAVVTLIALGVFGYIKGRFTGSRPGRSALQTIVIGGLAAGAAFLIAKAIS